MIISDNLAAHALGGFFCNFSTVNRFCRFCNCTKLQLQNKASINMTTLRTIQGYQNNIEILG